MLTLSSTPPHIAPHGARRPLARRASAATLLAMLAITTSQSASASELDPTFDTDGYVTLAFQNAGFRPDDEGVVACPGPLGSLVVVGLASADERIVTAWLTDGGALDTRFSDDGKHSVPLADFAADAITGLCHPNGRIYLAYDIPWETGGDGSRVVAIDPQTGAIDAAFGGAEGVELRLGDYVSSTEPDKMLSTLSLGPNGDLLISGYYRIAQVQYGAMFQLSTTGAQRGVLLGSRDFPAATQFGPASLASGFTWVVTTMRGASDDETTAIVELDDGLDVGRTVHASLGDDVVAFAARSTDDGFWVAARAGAQPSLLRITDARIARVNFPAPTNRYVHSGTLVPLGEGRVTAAFNLLNATNASAIGFARAVAGADGDVLADATFGTGGYFLAEPALPECGDGVRVMRLTNWNGRATAVGSVWRECANAGRDYFLARLVPGPLFANGFE